MLRRVEAGRRSPRLLRFVLGIVGSVVLGSCAYAFAEGAPLPLVYGVFFVCAAYVIAALSGFKWATSGLRRGAEKRSL